MPASGNQNGVDDVHRTHSLPKGLFLYTLALGTFAIGTESFMIAGLLPRIASDLWLVDQGSGGCGYP
jgi:predicted MFS family arabinose efflux permease